jgi:hypothetical protein
MTNAAKGGPKCRRVFWTRHSSPRIERVRAYQQASSKSAKAATASPLLSTLNRIGLPLFAPELVFWAHTLTALAARG